MKIEAIAGPIGSDLLRHICRLYGQDGDPRYADLEFTRRVFNSNPAGCSYHVFAFEGQEVIGCYAVIPVRVVARGRILWGGKGEGLFVRKEHRPAGLFLVQRGTSFAAERGLKLQFGLTHEHIGTMLQGLGFTRVTGVLDHRFRLLRPGDLQQLVANRNQLVAAKTLKAVQVVAGAAVSGLLRGVRVSMRLNHADHLNAVFSSISGASSHADGRWSVAADVDSLRWWNSVGCLDVFSVDDKVAEFVAVTHGARGGNSEIFRWNVRQGGLARALRILQLVIDKANQDGAACVSTGPYADMSGTGNLYKATALLGVVRRRAQRTIYVKAVDPFFRDPRNLQLNWLFSI